jgi:hypothetical protein
MTHNMATLKILKAVFTVYLLSNILPLLKPPHVATVLV